MKKKGFTLIELLAVIVILAIIALIATPIVMNVIENSRKGAAERSAENYLRAVETAIASERLDGPVTDGEYEVDANGDLVQEKDGKEIKIEVDVNGTLPEEGTIVVIVNGLVDKTQVIIVVGDYTVKENEEGKLEASKNEADSNNSVTVYRWSTETVNIGDELSSFTYVENPSDLGEKYYLKHVVENNVVTESYACAVFNIADKDEEVCVQGGDPNYYGYAENEANYAGNALILKGLQDEGFSCDFSAYISDCNGGSVRLYAYSNGNVNAVDGDGSGHCIVGGVGSSICESF